MSPEARHTLWNIYRRISERAPNERQPARFLIFTEEQANDGGFPAGHLTELALEGFLTEGRVRTLTKKGQAGQLEHSNPSTRYKMLRHLVFDELRSGRQLNPAAHISSRYTVEDCQDLGVQVEEIERAQQELADVGLLKLHAMNGDINSYTLTEFGKRACVQEYLVEQVLNGKHAHSPDGVSHVYHVQNHVNLGQGQVFQNTGPGVISIDQGDIVFGDSVPSVHQTELRRLFAELSAGFAAEDLVPADREDAQEALAKVTTELAKTQPEKSRLRRALATISETAEPFDKLASIAAQIAAVLQTLSLLS